MWSSTTVSIAVASPFSTFLGNLWLDFHFFGAVFAVRPHDLFGEPDAGEIQQYIHFAISKPLLLGAVLALLFHHLSLNYPRSHPASSKLRHISTGHLVQATKLLRSYLEQRSSEIDGSVSLAIACLAASEVGLGCNDGRRRC